MERPLDLEAIFPIKDAASAALMTIKADCVRQSVARKAIEDNTQYRHPPLSGGAAFSGD
jgi:hypothetical protein